MTKEDRTMGGSRDRRISEFQMPILPDPGKGDDLGSEPLDFSVRLGSTLARGLESESRKISRDHSFPSRRRSSCLILPIPERRISTILSPISPKDGDIPGSRSGAKVSRGRRESRRHSNNRTSTVANIYVTTIETARMRIHRIFRAVRIISGICLALKRYVKACETKTWSFMEMYLHVKEDLSQCVAFNPHSFSRVEPERHKLRKLLAIDGPDRTNGDVKVILALLRDNTSFQDYPFHVQYQLARCMSYQSYEARRVILKQGHRPEAFYILLSGSVMANIEDVSPESGKQFVKTVKEMGPGETFGEVALIEGGRRTASIVCKTNVELLVILKHDFDNIIREPLVEQIDEHLEFCRTMALFQDFPCDTLAENPSQKGDIVVRDSRVSKYIIVVKAAAFPHWDDMEKIRAKHRHTKSPAERTRETICLGLLTGQIDRNRLADHGPDVQRPKTSGLESLVQKPSCTTSLVSEGAECIFISKRLFLQLANIKVLRVVTDMVQNYPSQDFIQEQVKSYRTWQKYKKTLVQDVLDRMH
ncbi:CNBD2-like protein [Mya arenaria]|uniref:CNBD2-like protein n=1 Tax=Mya arenaria TaxID=6604 RepID=A0ABY7DKI9_MYAAR|nr:CNBD2-like protein [Mya arenaria]